MRRIAYLGLSVFVWGGALWAQTPAIEKPTAEGLEFFETKIRPVLAKNCYGCHSSDTKVAMGGMSLDTRTGIRRGGASGPAVMPGKVEESPLIHAVRHEGRKMPPSGKLPDGVVADLEKWVAMGAPDPREAKVEWKESTIDIEKGRKYWAFQAPNKPAPPKVKNAKWSSQPMDRLLMAAMEKKGLTPVADADRATWIRRVTLDLTGLLPAPDEVDAFLKDKRPDAYARVVDRLLASERYGERWGRHWLDVARYAESVGRGRNYAMPLSWRYRDWVIDAFNQDKPYDQFVAEQIAGDLLPAESAADRNAKTIAAGFLALGSHDLIEINPDIFRMDVVDEMINAASRSFMAVTVGCARCHDHKFDPIPTADYYAMAGIFRSTEMLSGLQHRPRDNVSYFNISLLAKLDLPSSQIAHGFWSDPGKVQEWDTLAQKLEEARNGLLPGQNKQRLPQAQIRQNTTQILLEMDRFPLPDNMAMSVREGKAADCEIHVRGDVKNLSKTVPRGFVQVVSRAGEKFEIGSSESGRLQLARWLARRENPLTARVMMNRVWHHLFGRGIVPTVDNFGAMGEKPTHPELLDYLAVRFMEQGWSVKKMIREITLSRAYRMSTAHNARNARIDADNNLFWRMNRRRLEVEAIRDSMMMVAGRLDLKRPEASPVFRYKRGFDVGRGVGTIPEDYAVKMNCRSVYVPVVRNFLPAVYETFDFPEPSETKGRREITTVPTQALFLVNSPFVLEQSKSAADRLLKDNNGPARERVVRVYREVLSRDPTEVEIERSMTFLDAMRSAQSGDNDEKTAWARLYQALFATAEFRYRS
ncbi:MAG: PSD1 domain-containing protein [Acidobacteria bacterium]|nr:PSD1 domain-containing protein [Acidobacteriota bacterium]